MPSNVNYCYRFIELPKKPTGATVDYRSEYDRDYARVLHSPAFRRLQNKTQLFPGQESDFFRNRLTHSLEVSQIAKSLAKKLRAEYSGLNVEPDVCAIAGLVHDIGHPPFGHIGEAALDSCMKEYGGFEGNAQTLRILTRLEKKEYREPLFDEDGTDHRVGLNLTVRVIASALKYDERIPLHRREDEPLIKGYYDSESGIVDKVKECLIGDSPKNNFKTVECSIMDIADDIAYSVYDIEDAFKAGFLTPCEILSAEDFIFEKIAERMKRDGDDISAERCRSELINLFTNVWSDFVEQQKRISPDSEDFDYDTLGNFLNFYRLSKKIAGNGYYRTDLTSKLVNFFINGVEVELCNEHPILSKAFLKTNVKIKVNILKYFSYIRLINSPLLKIVESRGRELVEKMFRKLFESKGHFLLPDDVKYEFERANNESCRARVVCDFIAGMTDRYALEFYCRMFSENPQTIFKPL